MSTVIMSQCWPIQGLSATQKAVLISLADNANDEGVCWPSIASIAERTCLSERAVRNSLRALEDFGLLESHQRRGRSTWYTVNPDGFDPGTTCPPASDAPRHQMPPTPAPDAPHPGTSCPPPRHHVPPEPSRNRKGTVREPSVGAAPRSDARSLSRFGLTDLLADNPYGVTEQVLSDWLTCRQRAKAAVTRTVWGRVNAELGKCVANGITADDALAEAQEAGWRGFKFEWVVNRRRNQGAALASADLDDNATGWLGE